MMISGPVAILMDMPVGKRFDRQVTEVTYHDHEGQENNKISGRRQ